MKIELRSYQQSINIENKNWKIKEEKYVKNWNKEEIVKKEWNSLLSIGNEKTKKVGNKTKMQKREGIVQHTHSLYLFSSCRGL